MSLIKSALKGVSLMIVIEMAIRHYVGNTTEMPISWIIVLLVLLVSEFIIDTTILRRK